MRNNNKIKCTRRCVTLIEMMIVMFLIALITGVVAYNYRGTLESGKAFKTQAGMEKLQTILSLALAEDPTIDLSGNNWQQYVSTSVLVKTPKDLFQDGWGEEYEVHLDPNHGVVINSSKLQAYKQKHGDSFFQK
jgi:general secretion pathway protein G